MTRTQSGDTITDGVVSAYTAGNADVFPRILSLHVPLGSKIADVTYGTGVFWSKVDTTKYTILASDISTTKAGTDNGVTVKTGVDCRNLPYKNESLDCVVLDPPYLESFYRQKPAHKGGKGSHLAFGSYYSNGSEVSDLGGPKWHDAVLQMYMKSGVEAYRVLSNDGIFIVKCQDEVSANKQRLTHIEIVAFYESLGLYAKDLFIVIRNNSPVIAKVLKQVHARKNHSYFLVFQKTREKGKLKIKNASPSASLLR